jgi:hypothetical protein
MLKYDTLFVKVCQAKVYQVIREEGDSKMQAFPLHVAIEMDISLYAGFSKHG